MRRWQWLAAGGLLGVVATLGVQAMLRQPEKVSHASESGALQPAAGPRRLAVKALAAAPAQPAPTSDGKLRIIAFGAHPDDCEIRCGGAAMLWSQQGHHVQFVSATNGDIGHWRMAGGSLAQRRFEEVQQAAKVLGVTTSVLDVHDGELLPTLENRREFTRAIRRWNADVVLSHRPNDYHPDHRYTGVLVQDSAYMAAVPFFCPDTPHLVQNPVYLFYWDDFQKPNPFRPDIAVAIDSVIEQKLDALLLMESQFVEGGALGYLKPFPESEQDRQARREEARENFRKRFAANANKYRDKLVELYGPERGPKIQYAEAFELCEYGRQPRQDELRAMFPLNAE